MSSAIQCPKCSKMISVEEPSTGKKVRCPGCTELFLIGVGPESLPPLQRTAVTDRSAAKMPISNTAFQKEPIPPTRFSPEIPGKGEAPGRHRDDSPADISLRRQFPMQPDDILSPSEYRNYRNVRAVAWLFTVLGSVLILGGIGLFFQKDRPRQEQIHPAVVLLVMFAGISGVVGGIGVLKGSRRFAPFVYLMAVLYLFAFPIGTILSAVLLTGLRKYLASVELIKSTRGDSE